MIEGSKYVNVVKFSSQIILSTHQIICQNEISWCIYYYLKSVIFTNNYHVAFAMALQVFFSKKSFQCTNCSWFQRAQFFVPYFKMNYGKGMNKNRRYGRGLLSLNIKCKILFIFKLQWHSQKVPFYLKFYVHRHTLNSNIHFWAIY